MEADYSYSPHHNSILQGEVTIVALGPMTNLAMACHFDPNFALNVGQLVWMGGTMFAKGNSSFSAEFNVHADPEAAHVVCVGVRVGV